MKPRLTLSLLFLPLIASAQTAFTGAQGFGAQSRGGKGGRVIHVTRLDDDVKSPKPGSFRWAVVQEGPRVVRFAVAGNIELEDRVLVRTSHLTLDGGDAPELGVCLKGGALEFRDCSDIIVRNLRVRPGAAPGMRENRLPFRWRPKGSRGLDCINILDCDRVIIDHCSLSWSCDEIVSVARSRDVTVQWCILSEPLASWRLHPYGDRHAYCLNASASTLSVHHCLFARYVMRGPQFEANDMRRNDRWPVKMEAVRNLMLGYEASGSRYTTGVEEHKEEAGDKTFLFQFLGNHYHGMTPSRAAIEGATKHGIHPGVHVGVKGNLDLAARDESGRAATKAKVRFEKTSEADSQKHPAASQVTNQRLFTAPVPVSESWSDPANPGRSFLESVGCSHARDAVDTRVITNLPSAHASILSGTREVGGWPPLSSSSDKDPSTGLTRKLFSGRR
jgi:hypothetical protein